MGGFLSLLFIGFTTGLLVYDLEQPQRFLYILLRPQWQQLAPRRGPAHRPLHHHRHVVALNWGLTFTVTTPALSAGFRGRPLPFAIGAAVYTAFLFAQAEGRDLWQSPLLPFHLVQAAMMGGAALLVMDLFMALPGGHEPVCAVAFVVALLVDRSSPWWVSLAYPTPAKWPPARPTKSATAVTAATFWIGSIAVGHAAAAAAAAGAAGLQFAACWGRWLIMRRDWVVPV